MIFKGHFRIYWGTKGDPEVLLGPGDIISVPTNCFRGFEVVGEEYGFMFALSAETTPVYTATKWTKGAEYDLLSRSGE